VTVELTRDSAFLLSSVLLPSQSPLPTTAATPQEPLKPVNSLSDQVRRCKVSPNLLLFLLFSFCFSSFLFHSPLLLWDPRNEEDCRNHHRHYRRADDDHDGGCGDVIFYTLTRIAQ
jgi:hypothetical protein